MTHFAQTWACSLADVTQQVRKGWENKQDADKAIILLVSLNYSRAIRRTYRKTTAVFALTRSSCAQLVSMMKWKESKQNLHAREKSVHLMKKLEKRETYFFQLQPGCGSTSCHRRNLGSGVGGASRDIPYVGQ